MTLHDFSQRIKVAFFPLFTSHHKYFHVKSHKYSNTQFRWSPGKLKPSQRECEILLWLTATSETRQTGKKNDLNNIYIYALIKPGSYKLSVIFTNPIVQI